MEILQTLNDWLTHSISLDRTYSYLYVTDLKFSAEFGVCSVFENIEDALQNLQLIKIKIGLKNL